MELDPRNAGVMSNLRPFALSPRLTNRAARSAVQLLSAEAGDQLLEDADLRDEATALLRDLFDNASGGFYRFQLQNGGAGREGDVLVNLWLTPDGDGTENAAVLDRLENWPLVLMGTSQPRRFGGEGTDFLLIDLVAVPPWSIDTVADAVPTQIAFDWGGRFASGIPAEIHASLQRLPVHRLQRDRVRLLLDDWGRFLEVRQRIAEAGRFSLDYVGYRLDEAGNRARFQVSVPDDFDSGKVRQANGEDIHLDLTPEEERVAQALEQARHGSMDRRDGPGEVLGEIRQLQGSWLEIRLDGQVAAGIRTGRRVLPKKGHLQYRAVGELAQVRRLRWGLESLLRGRVTNRRLGDFLFDPNEASPPDAEQAICLAPEDLLQPHLNPGQLRAVEGALSAPDLYLIQGPPGTGKTTVIAEICYQVAKRGGRTMVASQANLAVDNAMSKLVHDPSIRALRRGRAESVEEEGQPYLEDYVIGTWLDKIGTDCRADLDGRTRRAAELADLLRIEDAIETFEAARARYGSEIRGARAAATDAEEAHALAREGVAAAQTRCDALQSVVPLLTDLAASTAAEATVDAEPVSGAEGTSMDHATPDAPDDWVEVTSHEGQTDAGVDIRHPVLADIVQPDDMRSLLGLEAAVQAWTGDTGSTGSDSAGPESIDAHFFFDYVRRSRAAHERAERIAGLSATVAPKIEALGLLCRSWHDLMAREAPLLARQRTRQAAPARRAARIETLKATIAQQNRRVVELQQLLQEMHQIHRGITSWLLRRATIDGEMDEVPPVLRSPSRQQLWDGAVGDQRLPTLRGVAAKARDAREAADTLGRMAVQIDDCLGRLRPHVAARELAAAGRTPPDWQETALVDLVESDGDGTLVPVQAAAERLRPFLQTTLDRALATDVRVRLPERRAAANVVGLQKMADDLRESQQCLDQRAAIHTQEFTSVVNRLAAGLAGNLRAHILAKQQTLTEELAVSRTELATLEQQARAEQRGESEEDRQLEALADEKDRVAGAIRAGLLDPDASRLAPSRKIEATALDALCTAAAAWETAWDSALADLAAAQTALADAASNHEPEWMLSTWRQRAESAMVEAEGRLDEAERAVAASATARQEADAAVESLEAAHRAAREAWMASYDALPEAVRPETKSATSSATLDPLRDLCAAWSSEHAQLQAYLGSYTGFISDWIDRVTARNPQDEADLRQIYIDNANVIGITCVQAGSRGFSQRYRNFDTVIVDEVSKATPPELLLPMLKGAKVVLVGDSRQLPPMVGPEALQDLAESLGIEGRDLSHLERSLFRDLFERAPVALKSWLTDQYRMHPQIMDAINQFYHDKLACKIPEPDVARAHGLAPLIPALTHIAWIPTDWAPAFYESRAGTSRRNDKEVEIIANLVRRMNEVWGDGPDARPPKQIGVITFYAAQEQALRSRLLGRGGAQRFANLDLRLGTVDRFQGMEKPVIIVSLVCNNARRDIGFARELERINVAFSRAQELLVIVGSRELFCQRAEAGRAIERYARVADVVETHGGMLRASDFLSR